jgi:hypothetical protein
MALEIAKLMLEHAGTFLERTKAVRVAMLSGMPLNEIESYLDWLDATRGPLRTGLQELELTEDSRTGDGEPNRRGSFCRVLVYFQSRQRTLNRTYLPAGVWHRSTFDCSPPRMIALGGRHEQC